MPQKNVTCIDTFQSINNELAARFYFCHMVYINNNILLPQIKSLKGDFFLLTQTSFGVPTPNPSLDDGTRWWGKKKVSCLSGNHHRQTITHHFFCKWPGTAAKKNNVFQMRSITFHLLLKLSCLTMSCWGMKAKLYFAEMIYGMTCKFPAQD